MKTTTKIRSTGISKGILSKIWACMKIASFIKYALTQVNSEQRWFDKIKYTLVWVRRSAGGGGARVLVRFFGGDMSPGLPLPLVSSCWLFVLELCFSKKHTIPNTFETVVGVWIVFGVYVKNIIFPLPFTWTHCKVSSPPPPYSHKKCDWILRALATHQWSKKIYKIKQCWIKKELEHKMIFIVSP